MDLYVMFAQIGEMIEYYFTTYPLQTFGIMLGMFIITMLAVMPRYQSSPVKERVVIHRYPTEHRATQIQIEPEHREPAPVVVRHVYSSPAYEEPEYEEPVQERKRRRFPSFDDIDLCDNWGFLDK